MAKTFEEMTDKDKIALLVECAKAYQHLFLAIKPKLKFYPALTKDMAYVTPVQERLEGFMKKYHEAEGRQYFPAVTHTRE